MLRNEDICKIVRLNERSLQRIKHHLKELGYIRTDGGIRVTYIKGRGDTGVAPGVTKMTSKGDTGVAPGVTKLAKKGDTGVAHNKERIKINKKNKEKMTNLDQLLNRLPDDYKTPEIVEFIKNNYLDRINQMDFSEGGVIDSCVVALKSELLKKFTIYTVPDKPLPVKKTDDNDFMW